MDRRERFRPAALQAHSLGGNESSHRGCRTISAQDDAVRERQGNCAGRGERMTAGSGKAGSGRAGSGKREAGREFRPDDGRVQIFDTTLRDGEQAPGCTMMLEEKLAVAHQLARLKVDVIEAGFPAASEGDWAAVHQIACDVGGAHGPEICGLARANERDIDRCWTAVEPAANARIHIVLATSDLHMKHKLGMTRSQVVPAVASSVSHARTLGAQVEFSAEDAARSDPTFLHQVLTPPPQS